MNLLLKIIASLLIGMFFAFLFVGVNKIVMKNYKEEHQVWWTPKRYRIMFIIITVVIAVLRVVIYIID